MVPLTGYKSSSTEFNIYSSDRLRMTCSNLLRRSYTCGKGQRRVEVDGDGLDDG